VSAVVYSRSPVSVSGYQLEAVAVERENEVEIRGQIANAPQLCLARAEHDHRTGQAVDGADDVFADVGDHNASIFELKTFEQRRRSGKWRSVGNESSSPSTMMLPHAFLVCSSENSCGCG